MNEITLIQGLLLMIVVFICALDQQMEAFYWFRPMVVAFFSGIVLGDMELGVKAGAVAELSYLGLLTVGGTVPPDPLMAGFMTVVIAYTTGRGAETALGLSLPFALLAQWLGIFFNTAYSTVVRMCEKAAKAGDTGKFTRICYGGWFVKSGAMAIVAFLAAYGLQEPIQNFVNAFPTELVHGFEVAGNMLPAVGLGLLLMVMLNNQNIPYLFIGFFMVTFTGVDNVLPIAMVAVAIAYIDYLYNQKMKAASAAAVAVDGGDDEDGI